MSSNAPIGSWLPTQTQTTLPPEVEADFSPQERDMWSLSDGAHTVQSIADSIGFPVDVVHQILTVWESRGLIQWLSQNEAAVVEAEVLDVEEFDVELLEVMEDDDVPDVAVVEEVSPVLPNSTSVAPRSHGFMPVTKSQGFMPVVQNPSTPSPESKSPIQRPSASGQAVVTGPPPTTRPAVTPSARPATATVTSSSGAIPRASSSASIPSISATSLAMPTARNVPQTRATATATAGPLRIPGAANAQPSSGGTLRIPGASSGRWPKPGESLAAEKDASSSGFRWPKPGESLEQVGEESGGQTQFQSQDNLPIAGASADASEDMTLRIPGANSGGHPDTADHTMRIPGASSMVMPDENATTIHVVGQGASRILDSRLGEESASTSLVPVDESQGTVLEIMESEKEVFVEAAWEAAHSEMESVGEKEKLTLARSITKAFDRVTRTFQLYEPSNKAVRDALSSLFTQLMTFLKSDGDLPLVIEKYTMTLEGEVVYNNPEREYSLAFKLYRDGIRGLRLMQGLHWEELAQLLKIFGMRYSGVHSFEDDIATLFWKADFQFIDVVAVEGFGFERFKEGGKPNVEMLFERIEAHSPEEYAEGAEANKQRQFLGAISGAGSSLSSAIREENAQGLLRELSPVPVKFIRQDEEDTEPLLVENKSDRLHEHVVQLFSYIDKSVLNLAEVTGADGIRHLLREFLGFLISDGRPKGIVDLLNRATRWSRMLDHRGRLLAPIAEELLASFDSPDMIRKFLGSKNITNEFGQFRDGVFDILCWGDVDRRGLLAQALNDEKNPSVREILRKALMDLVGEDMEFYVEQLREAETQLALELIDCLVELNTPEAIQILASLLEDADPKVQDKVLGLAETLFEGPQNFAAIRSILGRLVESELEEERIRAYGLIEASEDKRWLPMLKKTYEAKVERSEREMEELARLIARLDGLSSLRLFLEGAEPPKMLSVERTWRKLQRMASVRALGQLGGPRSEKAIRVLMEKTDGPLHAACLEAMREMRRNQGREQRSLPKRLQQKEKDLELLRLEEESAALAKKQPSSASPEEVGYEGDVNQIQEMLANSLQHIDLKSENEFSVQVRELGGSFVIGLHMLLKNRSLYDPNNEIFTKPLGEIQVTLEKILDVMMSATLVGMDGQFYINDVRVRAPSDSVQHIFAELSQTFQRLGMGGVTFNFPMDESDWRLLIDLLSRQGLGERCANWRDISAELVAHNIHRKVEVFGQLRTRLSGERDKRTSRPLSDVFIDGCDAVEDAWFFAVRGLAPNPVPIRRFVNDVVDSLMEGNIRDFSVLAFEDPAEPMKTHWLQVSLLSMLIGHSLGFDKSALADLGMAAFYHDVGHAVFVDPDVRRGDGWQTLNHQQAGMALLLRHRGFHESKVRRLLGIAEHHLNAHPTNKQPEPKLFSRIIRTADVYDTLTSALCGGKPLSPTEAFEHMRSGIEKQFDGLLLQLLVNRLGHYPPGTIVAIDDGTVAVSMGHNGTPETFERPRLILVRDAKGKEIPQRIIDLSQEKFAPVKVLGIVPHDPWLEPKKKIVQRLWPRIAAMLEERAQQAAANAQAEAAQILSQQG